MILAPAGIQLVAMIKKLKITTWNVRGLKGKAKRVHAEIRRLKPHISVLCETRIKPDSLKNSFDNGWGTLSWISNHEAHPGGRLVILWDSSAVSLSMLTSYPQYIDCSCKLYDGFTFDLTAVYGFNDDIGRSSLWSTISLKGTSCDKAWIALGDFNAVRRTGERVGKQIPTQRSMDDFNRAILEANLLEIDYKGTWFTWDNRQMGNDLVLSKIDRFFYNDLMLEKCSNIWGDISSTSISDHQIITTHLDIIIPKKKIPFKHINA